MRVPVDWLREYVAVPAGARGADIAADLVRVGLEEEAIHGGGLTGPLVVGRVLTKDPEPQKNGKTISWCTVDVGDANGTGEPQGIVCGADNFEAGDLVVVMLPGGVLPGGFTITARKTYGHVSAGMICSVRELGIGEDHTGILVLSGGPDGRALVPGQDAIPLLGLDRETVEVNVTPDRGYCFSIRGIAREYSHATGAAYTDPALGLEARAPAANGRGYVVDVRDDAPIRGRQGCDRYVARIVRGIDVHAPTPPWMATRLTEAGMRSISLPVDVTNYVMLGLGQPLHAFDVASLTGSIVVRRARPGERMTTLDGTDRALSPTDLLITDGGERPLAIAGVMGGEDCEVTDTTTDVLIEAAHFDPVTVARSARRHRLPSEASRRFERGVDPAIAAAAAQLAVELLVEHGGGAPDEGVTDVGTPVLPSPFTMDAGLPGRLVGVPYAASDVARVLTEIGCVVAAEGDRLTVTPPSWRPDLRQGPDLAEEVARIEGYAGIPSLLPTPPGGRGLTRAQRVRRLLGDVLAAQGLEEIWSAPFTGDDRHLALGLDPADVARRTVRLANPLSEEAPYFRISVVSTMVDALRRNVSRGAKDVGLFEVGLVVARTGTLVGAPTEEVGVRPSDETLAEIRAAVPPQPTHLGVLLAGDRDRAGWWGAGRKADVADLLEIVRGLGESLALDLAVTSDGPLPWHPGRCARVGTADGALIGWAGELHPKVVAALGLPERTLAAELDVDALVRASEDTVVAHTLVTSPRAQSDVALVVDASVPAERVRAALVEGGGELVESVDLFDLYEGGQVGDGKKSLAYRLVVRARNRTLTTEEVNAIRDRAVAAAARAVGAVQR